MANVSSQPQARDRQSKRNLLYHQFDDEMVWEVFTSPNSKVTKEDAKSRAWLANSKSQKLSQDEAKERKIWMKKREDWERRAKSVTEIHSNDKFLAQRVLTPYLQHEPKAVSRSSSKKERRKRLFPPRGKVQEWAQFDDSVSNFEHEEHPNCELDDPWMGSVYANGPLANEAEEKAWLKLNVLDRLQKVKLLDNTRTSACTVGSPDLCLYSGNEGQQRIVACVEAKSTHNLWLPSNADHIVTNYDECWVDSDLIHCVAHPIGQVARTMIVNSIMHGAITSATRTYFVRFALVDGELHLLLSRRWYVGERNYLRAWAWFYNSALREDRLELVKDLHSTWKELSPREVENRRSSRIAEKKDGQRVEILSLRVKYDDIEFTGRTLGDGRNGIVREAVWRNINVAVKSFDIDHGSSDSFYRELDSYIKLKDVQGLLVPKLHFWAKHWTGSLFVLGLQIGTDMPFSIDRDHSIEKETVLQQLYRLGFTHLDSDDFRNFTYIPDGLNDHRMVVLDLESLEPCQPSSPVTQSSDYDFV